MFQMFRPGVLTVLRPVVGIVPTPAWMKRAAGFAATYPTTLASAHVGEVAVAMRVAPPAPSLQTGLTIEPVLPTPAELKMVRSPAASPLSLESTAESGVTGWPDCARYVPLNSQPCASVRTKACSLLMFGTSYTQVTANLLGKSRAERPRSPLTL